MMGAVVDEQHKRAAAKLREILAKYKEIELLVQIGEYKQGADPAADEAIAKIGRPSNAFLRSGAWREQRPGFAKNLATDLPGKVVGHGTGLFLLGKEPWLGPFQEGNSGDSGLKGPRPEGVAKRAGSPGAFGKEEGPELVGAKKRLRGLGQVWAGYLPFSPWRPWNSRGSQRLWVWDTWISDTRRKNPFQKVPRGSFQKPGNPGGKKS